MTQSFKEDPLVKVAYAQDESEAEPLQGLLRTADVGSVVRRAPGFDVPEFLSVGPRDVLVAESDVPIAREVLREVETDEQPGDPGEPESAARPGDTRRLRIRVALLLVVAVVTLVVCVAADVI